MAQDTSILVTYLNEKLIVANYQSSYLEELQGIGVVNNPIIMPKAQKIAYFRSQTFLMRKLKEEETSFLNEKMGIVLSKYFAVNTNGTKILIAGFQTANKSGVFVIIYDLVIEQPVLKWKIDLSFKNSTFSPDLGMMAHTYISDPKLHYIDIHQLTQPPKVHTPILHHFNLELEPEDWQYTGDDPLIGNYYYEYLKINFEKIVGDASDEKRKEYLQVLKSLQSNNQ